MLTLSSVVAINIIHHHETIIHHDHLWKEHHLTRRLTQDPYFETIPSTRVGNIVGNVAGTRECVLAEEETSFGTRVASRIELYKESNSEDDRGGWEEKECKQLVGFDIGNRYFV